MYEFKLRIHISGWLILALLLVILLCHFVPSASAAEASFYNFRVETPVLHSDGGYWRYIGRSNLENYTALMKVAYEQSMAVIIAADNSSLFGFFWNEDGLLCTGRWDNSDGIVDSSDFGALPLSSIMLEKSAFSNLIFYSKELAEAYPSFASSMVYAVSWDFAMPDAHSFYYFYSYAGDGYWSDSTTSSVYILAFDFLPSSYYSSSSDGTSWFEVDLVPPITSAALPVFTVQPPLITCIEYNVGDTASPVTVAAVADDGGIISYTWYRTIFPDSGVPSNVVFSTGSTLVPDTSVVSYSSYYCVATNTNGEFSQSAYSQAYRVKVVESGAADPPSETPTYPSAEDIGTSVGDAFQGILDQNDINASEQGNSFVDQITQIVPNESQGFVNAMGGLVDSLSYGGTECVLTVPALVMPQIGDLVPQYTLLEKQEVDLESYFNMFPDFIVTLVQSLFTVALIVFCFKELYSTVSYFFVLRGGET